MNNFSISFNNPMVLENYIESGQPLNILDNSTDFTLFMYVCNQILNIQPYKPWAKIAMKMLDFTPEQLNLQYSNRDGITALILVCGVDIDVSLKIINFGPTAINLNAVEKNNNMNALMYSCTEDTEEVAIELLNFPQITTSLKNINNMGYTPLMFACEEGLEQVALKMLEDFPSASLNLFQKNNIGQTAFDLALEHEHMQFVYRLLNELMNDEEIMGNIIPTSSDKPKNWAHKEIPAFPNFPTPDIDINGTGYDSILLEERNIKDYLEEDKKDNIVILYEGKNYLLSKSIIERQMEDAIVFECIKAEGTKDFPNVVHNIPLYNIKAVGIDIPQDKTGIWPEFIYMNGIELLLNSKEQLFSIMPLVDIMFVSVMSLSESKEVGTGNGSGLSSLHCQNGQGGMAGTIVPAKATIAGGKKNKTIKKKILNKKSKSLSKTLKKRNKSRRINCKNSKKKLQYKNLF